MRGLRAVCCLVLALTGALVTAPLSATASPGQEIEDGTVAAAAALVDTLVGAGVTVSDVQYTGSPSAIGGFTGMDAVGISSGVVMSSGYVDTGGENTSVILGPNVREDVTGVMETPGDSDLAAIIAPIETFDAAVLEFDFVSTAAEVRFLYVFGSDEYNEYVGGGYNDVFAFFINGVNCATVDTGSGESPASINSINLANNASLFNNNDASVSSPFDTEMDGFTTVLTCAAAVVPGATNTAKLAIADGGDPGYDTAVLFAAGSFAANNPPVAKAAKHSGAIDAPLSFTLKATDPEDDALTYTVTEQPTDGVLTGTGADLVFTPAPGWTGTTTLTFEVDDGSQTSAPAVVTLTISASIAPTELPPTGSDPGMAASLAAGALIGGAGLLALTLRRRPLV
jgi:hypothetical protein